MKWTVRVQAHRSRFAHPQNQLPRLVSSRSYTFGEGSHMRPHSLFQQILMRGFMLAGACSFFTFGATCKYARHGLSLNALRSTGVAVALRAPRARNSLLPYISGFSYRLLKLQTRGGTFMCAASSAWLVNRSFHMC